MTVAIYTAVYGDYDRPAPPPKQNYPCEFFIWGQRATGWIYRDDVIPPLNDPTLQARATKILSHWHFPRHDMTIWIDGAIRITSPDFVSWCMRFMDNPWGNFAVHRHRWRNTPDQEIREVQSLGFTVRGDPMSRWLANGFRNENLYETGVLVRRSSTQVIQLLECTWATELLLTSTRDQISLPYALWRRGVKPNIIPGAVTSGPHHRWVGHAKPWRIV